MNPESEKFDFGFQESLTTKETAVDAVRGGYAWTLNSVLHDKDVLPGIRGSELLKWGKIVYETTQEQPSNYCVCIPQTHGGIRTIEQFNNNPTYQQQFIDHHNAI